MRTLVCAVYLLPGGSMDVEFGYDPGSVASGVLTAAVAAGADVESVVENIGDAVLLEPCSPPEGSLS
jgi:hypothetical protein